MGEAVRVPVSLNTSDPKADQNGPGYPAESAAGPPASSGDEGGVEVSLSVSRSAESLPLSRLEPGRPVTASGMPVIRVPSSRIRSPIRRHDPETLLTDVPSLMLPLWQYPRQGMNASRSLGEWCREYTRSIHVVYT